MSAVIRKSIKDINELLNDLSTNFDVQALTQDILTFMQTLKDDKIMIESLNTQIAEAKRVAINPDEFRELTELNIQANDALIAAKDQLEKYKATLLFLKSLSGIKSAEVVSPDSRKRRSTDQLN